MKPPTFDVPAGFRGPSGEGWGRLTDLVSKKVRLVTAAVWDAGAEGTLTFELGGQTFRDLKVRASREEEAGEGYAAVTLSFLDYRDVDRLQAVLLDLWTRK